MNQKPQVATAIAFCEPGIAYGDPLLSTLQEMAQHVSDIITGFAPFLS
jgi:hypothetical protein